MPSCRIPIAARQDISKPPLHNGLEGLTVLGTGHAGIENVVQLQLQMVVNVKRAQETIDAMRSLMVPAQFDRGCCGCRLYLDALNPQSLLYVEEWASPTDLEREICSARFTRLLSVMENAPTRPTLEFRYISQIRGLDYVEEVRAIGRNGKSSKVN